MYLTNRILNEVNIMNEIIDQAIAYVKELFENEYSGHDYFHTIRVFKTATLIGKEENANLEIVQLAALLHDVDDRKLSPETYLNQSNAKTFLLKQKVDTATIDNICEIIREISYMGIDSVIPKSVEGKCVQDADRLDALGAIGIARAFAYGGNHNRQMYDPDILPNTQMNKDAYFKSQSTTINHFYEKLLLLSELMNTATAQKIAKQREEYMRAFLDEFFAEWNGVR